MTQFGAWLLLIGTIIFGLILVLDVIVEVRVKPYSGRALALAGFLVGLGAFLIHRHLL